MKRYSEERKQAVLIKMMAPENKGAMELSEETGIPYQTLYNWRKQAKEKGCAVPGNNKNPEKWSSSDKFATVLETASLNEAELGEYCRKKGLYVEQIQEWKLTCMNANASQIESDKLERERSKLDKKRIKRLERELNRKEKALAETAALLVLQKKAREIWGDPEDD